MLWAHLARAAAEPAVRRLDVIGDDDAGHATRVTLVDVTDLDPFPMTQFGKWFAEAVAAGLPEPNAMVLATMGDRPHARTVLLKSHDESGITFYTNRTSRKGNDLA